MKLLIRTRSGEWATVPAERVLVLIGEDTPACVIQRHRLPGRAEVAVITEAGEPGFPKLLEQFPGGHSLPQVTILDGNHGRTPVG